MAVTLYDHTCKVCGSAFETRLRTSQTCSRSCRGKLARSAPAKTLCACGKLANRRKLCADCAKHRLHTRLSRYYAENANRISEQRATTYATDHQLREMIYATSVRSRFNGLRAARLDFDRHTCQQCSSTEQLVVRHLAPIPGRAYADRESTLHDLITLCRRCHILMTHASGAMSR